MLSRHLRLHPGWTFTKLSASDANLSQQGPPAPPGATEAVVGLHSPEPLAHRMHGSGDSRAHGGSSTTRSKRIGTLGEARDAESRGLVDEAAILPQCVCAVDLLSDVPRLASPPYRIDFQA